MSASPPAYFSDLEQCVEALLGIVGKHVVIAGGFGRPVHIFNELYRRAAVDRELRLTIITGASFSRPKGKSDLEARFLDPFVDRVFGNLPELDYVQPYMRGNLPDNIEVVEVFLQAGMFTNSPYAQQNFVYSNFTHWLRDMVEQGCNVFSQMVAKRSIDGRLQYSMSCDAYALDIIPRIQALRESGKPVAVLGQVNEQLPFMYNDAVVPPETYDLILDNPSYNHTLLGPPSPAVDTVDYMIGLNAAAMIPDGGTLQIGIGALGDAISYGCILRQEKNAAFRSALTELGTLDNAGAVIDELGGTDIFQQGLYGSTEMFADGFRHLYNHGILKRAVYDDPTLQRLKNSKHLTDKVTPETLSLLYQEGRINAELSAADLEFLIRYGIFHPAVTLQDGRLCCPDGSQIPARLDDPEARKHMNERCLGQELTGGIVLHAGFFLGPQAMYEQLRTMDENEAKKICMTDIAFVNQLYGCEELARLQRQQARFINTAMMISLLGAACSDGLEDGRKISGVGGQYNFVAMAHALADARSILLCRSTRHKNKTLSSNIVWNYGHATIPAHLRDVVITEYGIAMLRGQREKDVIASLLNITDSRFQSQLLDQAKAAGKIEQGYTIPERFRNNTPDRLNRIARSMRGEGLLPRYPFGTDFTDEELVLAQVLSSLKSKMSNKASLLQTLAQATRVAFSKPSAAQPYLHRMGLEQTRGLKQSAAQKLIIAELKHGGYI
ncbi:MAG: acetyl-CoA hydrolase/transferase C-terminal domain-containing protein [Pseudomonadota bacterium]